MDEANIIDQAMNGADLHVFLRPNPDVSYLNNQGEYIENYPLPFVVISGDKLWGTSRRSHLVHSKGQNDMSIAAFSYSPEAPFYVKSNIASRIEAIQSENISLKLNPIEHYSDVVFQSKPRYQKIWESGDTSFKALAKKIESGCKFKLALKLPSNSWVICPVDLPFYYPETNRFSIQTELEILPAIFMVPDQLKTYLETQQPEFLESDALNRNIEMTVKSFPTFFKLNSEGNYYDMHQIPASESTSFTNAILFAENI